MSGALPDPTDGPLVTVLLISDRVEETAAFYEQVLGGALISPGPPALLQLANTWLQIAEPGGPTPDKPGVHAVTPTPDRFSAALNIRVRDIRATVDTWTTAGAEFLTPPALVPSAYRCFLRDPDGRLIELAQLLTLPPDAADPDSAT